MPSCTHFTRTQCAHHPARCPVCERFGILSYRRRLPKRPLRSLAFWLAFSMRSLNAEGMSWPSKLRTTALTSGTFVRKTCSSRGMRSSSAVSPPSSFHGLSCGRQAASFRLQIEQHSRGDLPLSTAPWLTEPRPGVWHASPIWSLSSQIVVHGTVMPSALAHPVERSVCQRKRLQGLPGPLENARRTAHLDCIVRLQCVGVRVCGDEQHLVQIPVEVVEVSHLRKMPTSPDGPVLAQCWLCLLVSWHTLVTKDPFPGAHHSQGSFHACLLCI